MTPRHIILILAAVNIGLLATLGLVIYWIKTSPSITISEKSPPIRIENTVTQISVKKFNATNLLAQLANRKIGWAAIESTNYLFYIQNLRNISCPEQTVRDIIIADIANLYSQRRASLRAQWEPLPYWQTGQGEIVPTEIRAQIQALNQEQDELVRALLGVDYRGQVAKYFRRDSSENFLYSFLAPQTRVALQSILSNYEALEDQVRAASGGVMLPADREQLEQLRLEREQALADLLTPEELAQFTMTTSPLANELREELYGFEPSQAEFDQIFKVRKAFDMVLESTLEGNWDIHPELRDQAEAEAEQALNAELESILGETRFDEYVRTKDPDYQSVLKMAERLELPTTLAKEVYDMKLAARQQRDGILSNPMLNDEQRRLALRAMQFEVRASLSQTLGDANYKAYQAVGSDWLQDLGYLSRDYELTAPEQEFLEIITPTQVAQ